MNESSIVTGAANGRKAPPRRPYSARKARERARRCADVLAAARRLYSRKGFQGTPMVEIARASELAVGTLYQLFTSKEAILRSLLEERMDALIARVRQATLEPGDVEVQLDRVVRAHLGFARENADVLRLYLSGWIGYDFAVRRRFGERIDAKYEQYLALLAHVFERGVRSGRLAARPPRRLAVTLAGMVHAVIRRWLRERTLDLDAEAGALVDLFCRGALSRPAAGRGSR
jgi:AcrR family transcriptional regulator